VSSLAIHNAAFNHPIPHTFSGVLKKYLTRYLLTFLPCGELGANPLKKISLPSQGLGSRLFGPLLKPFGIGQVSKKS